MYCDALLQTAHRYFQMEMLKFLPFSHQHPCYSVIPALDLAEVLKYCKAADKNTVIPFNQLRGMTEELIPNVDSLHKSSFQQNALIGQFATSKLIRDTVPDSAGHQGVVAQGRRPRQEFFRSALLL